MTTENSNDKAPDAFPFQAIFPEGTPDEVKGHMIDRLAYQHRLRQLSNEAFKRMLKTHDDVCKPKEEGGNMRESILRFQAEALAALVFLHRTHAELAQATLREDPPEGVTPEDWDASALGFADDAGELSVALRIVREMGP